MTEALKPCPFCNGEAKLSVTIAAGQWWQVECQNAACECQGLFVDNENVAVAAWNTRPSTPPAVNDHSEHVLGLVEEVARAMQAVSRPDVDPDKLTPGPRGSVGLMYVWQLYEHMACAIIPIIHRREQQAAEAMRERAAKACEEQQRVFLSDEYSTGQPLASFGERFACGVCIGLIRALPKQEASNA